MTMPMPTPAEETPRAKLDRKPDEETTSVYWIGDPDATAISVGVVHDLQIPKGGKIEVPVSIAVYLTSVQPSFFSAAPPLKSTASTPTPDPKG